jgi:Phosphoheptose isomerase
MKTIIKEALLETKSKLEEFINDEKSIESIDEASKVMANALINGRKIISCGNGGSLCDATHFAEELTGRYRGSRMSLPAIAINDPGYMTCVGNDFDFNEIFARYVSAFGKKDDVLLAISTSGNSENIIRAVIQAREKMIKVVALTSKGDNSLSKLADIVIAAPSSAHSDRIQEIHGKVIHILIQTIEQRMNLS